MDNTVHARELSAVKMVAGNENRYTRVIDSGNLKNWVGFGWIDEGPASAEDRAKYPEVIRDD